jgi:hypothetical protein
MQCAIKAEQGSLAPGESVTVTFDVTINNTLPPTLQGTTKPGGGFRDGRCDDSCTRLWADTKRVKASILR